MHEHRQPRFLPITLCVSMPMTSSTNEVNGMSTRWSAYAFQWRSLHKNVHSPCHGENQRNVLNSLMTVITRFQQVSSRVSRRCPVLSPGPQCWSVREFILTTEYNCAKIKLTTPRYGCSLCEMYFTIHTGVSHDQE